jgi:hypothetical protein
MTRHENSRFGEIVRLLRREPIGGINEGIIERMEVYLVRWPLPNGATVEGEAPAVNLPPASSPALTDERPARDGASGPSLRLGPGALEVDVDLEGVEAHPERGRGFVSGSSDAGIGATRSAFTSGSLSVSRPRAERPAARPRCRRRLRDGLIAVIDSTGMTPLPTRRW